MISLTNFGGSLGSGGGGVGNFCSTLRKARHFAVPAGLDADISYWPVSSREQFNIDSVETPFSSSFIYN